MFHNIQTADRLANGNTVIFSSTGETKAEDLQLVEVTPDKKAVWVLQDWKNPRAGNQGAISKSAGYPRKARRFAAVSPWRVTLNL